MYRIGSGAGFSGDRIDAAQSVVAEIARHGQGGAVIFETLGERTLALGQIARMRDATKGYDPLLSQFLPPILRTCAEAGIVIIGNFGCANPRAAAGFIAEEARRQGLASLRIAVVVGDDLLGTVNLDEAERWDGDEGLARIDADVIAVNAYIGARGIAEAIVAGANVVVTGRVADPSLVLGPLVAHYGWDWGNHHLMASGTLVGHLLECGAQVTGGYFADPGYKHVPDPARIGFPIAEIEPDGTFVITKAPGTGGVVDRRTVSEQLLYEIHDPSAYLTPDVTLDLTSVEIEEVGPDRVRVWGARGYCPPEKLKATVSYAGDWLAEAEISYAGPNSRARAELAVEIIRERLAIRTLDVKMRADLIGVISAFDSDGASLRAIETGHDDADLRVRFAFSAADEDVVSAAAQEVNALYCCGPAGGGGVRSHVRPRIRTQSFLVARDKVNVRYHFLGDA